MDTQDIKNKAKTTGAQAEKLKAEVKVKGYKAKESLKEVKDKITK